MVGGPSCILRNEYEGVFRMKRMETTEKVIGENTFYIRPFAAFTAANISGEVIAVLSPVLGGLAPLFGNMGKEEAGKKEAGKKAEAESSDAANWMDMDIEKALPSITDALGGVDGDKIEHLMKRLLVDTGNISVEGPDTDGSVKVLDRDLADEVFCGEIQDMLILCFEVIKLNFKGFFKKLGARSGSLTERFQRTVAPTLVSGESST